MKTEKTRTSKCLSGIQFQADVIEKIADETINAHANGELTFGEAMWNMKRVLAHVDALNREL